jgi:hypothetical protein
MLACCFVDMKTIREVKTIYSSVSRPGGQGHRQFSISGLLERVKKKL